MIKNIEEFKKYNIICTNTEEVRECLNMLRDLGLAVHSMICTVDRIVRFRNDWQKFQAHNCVCDKNDNINFYQFKKVYNKQKKEKEQQADFEVAEDSRIIKINNYSSEQVIYVACDYNHIKEGYEIFNLNPTFLDFALKYGLAYATEQARDRALFKLEIETKLKNIAERLNAGRKIDWEDGDQSKFIIFYNYRSKILGLLDLYGVYHWKCQGAIFCLDKNFLKVAKQEIGEENLIKYFKD